MWIKTLAYSAHKFKLLGHRSVRYSMCKVKKRFKIHDVIPDTDPKTVNSNRVKTLPHNMSHMLYSLTFWHDILAFRSNPKLIILFSNSTHSHSDKFRVKYCSIEPEHHITFFVCISKGLSVLFGFHWKMEKFSGIQKKLKACQMWRHKYNTEFWRNTKRVRNIQNVITNVQYAQH